MRINQQTTEKKKLLRVKRLLSSTSVSFIILFFLFLGGCTGSRLLPYEGKEPDLRPEALLISPRSGTVVAGNYKKFSINYRDFDGNYHIPERVEWSVSEGTITDNGEFKAPMKSGPYVIKAKYAGIAVSADVTVIPNDYPVKLEINPTIAEVVAGSRINLTLLAWNNAGIDLDYHASWHSDRGRIEVQSENFGPQRSALDDLQDYRTREEDWKSQVIYYAPRLAGSDQITAKLATGEEALAVLEIVPGRVTSMAIRPANVAVAPGTSQSFSAIPYDEYGNIISGTVFWSANNGFIDSLGVYQSPVTGGSTLVSATFGGITRTVSVNNAVLGDPVRIEVTPSTGTIQQGDSIAFVAIGYDINGNQVNLRSPSWTSNNGEINNFGFYSAWNSVPGPLVVRVTQNGAIGEANITINPW